MTSPHQRLSGRLFRYQLTLLLRDARRPMTVVEIAEALELAGFDVPGRTSKVISDALRWEVARGRVRRTRRSRYELGTMPASTGRWMRSVIVAHGG